MSRDNIDLNDPDSWSAEDVKYLNDRGLLPKSFAAALQADQAWVGYLQGNLSEPRPLDERPNTGNINSAGLTHEEFNRAVELLRLEQNGELEVPDTSDEDPEDPDEEDDESPEPDPEEDYEEGWNNDRRRAELSSRGLSVEGNKEELIERLLASDNQE